VVENLLDQAEPHCHRQRGPSSPGVRQSTPLSGCPSKKIAEFEILAEHVVDLPLPFQLGPLARQ
jgi:hypothetical protein